MCVEHGGRHLDGVVIEYGCHVQKEPSGIEPVRDESCEECVSPPDWFALGRGSVS